MASAVKKEKAMNTVQWTPSPFYSTWDLSHEMCYPHLGWNFLAQFNFSGSFLRDRPRGMSSR